ncbi:hypothetical protein [Mucilaginibacter lappiensis]
MQAKYIIELLKQKADPVYLAGMQRYAIDTAHAIGVRSLNCANWLKP